MKNIILLLIFIFAFVDSMLSQAECGYGYELQRNTYLPETYKNSCVPIERNFTLRLYLNSRNDTIILDAVNFSSCQGVSNVITIMPIAGNKVVPVDPNFRSYINFSFKMKDEYAGPFPLLCGVEASWRYTNGGTGITTTCVDEFVGFYDVVPSVITNPISENFAREKQCGKKEVIDVSIDYENDITSYAITVSNGGTLVPNSAVLNTSNPCYPKLSFKIATTLCGDVDFKVDRTNTAGTKTETYKIKSKFTPDPSLPYPIRTFSGSTDFCLQNGAAGAILMGPLNNYFWGTNFPSYNTLQNSLCIQTTWTLDTGDPTGIFLLPTSPLADLAFKIVNITKPGRYRIKCEIICDGNKFERFITLKACDGLPFMASTPPIDIQFICSLEGLNSNCVNINAGCASNFTVTDNDPKLISVINQNGHLCLGSIFVRNRVSRLTVTASNACGSTSAIWNIHIDNPAHCLTTGNKLDIINNSNVLIAIITPAAIENFDSKNEIESDEYNEHNFENENETIQSLEIYDISGRLISSYLNINNTSFEIPTQNLLENTIYIVRVVTDKNEYSAKFIKS